MTVFFSDGKSFTETSWNTTTKTYNEKKRTKTKRHSHTIVWLPFYFHFPFAAHDRILIAPDIHHFATKHMDVDKGSKVINLNQNIK